MKKGILFIICCFLKINLLTAATISIADLKCENLFNPVAIDHTEPHFSWKISGDYPMQQHYYEIQVASDSLQLKKSTTDLWNSGKIQSCESVMVPYQGKELTSRQLCYWRVRIWNEKGETSHWSNIHQFAIGIVGSDRLRGEYIGLSKGEGDLRAPLLRKSFKADNNGTTFLHVNSLGYHEIYLNGEKVGDDVLSPAVSHLPKRSLIVTYDVTPYIINGENELVVWLGEGWYKETTYGTEYDGPLVKAEMDQLRNGKWECLFATDTSWKGRESGYNDTGTWQALRFGGERIDSRLVPRDLTKKGLNEMEWFPVTSVQVTTHLVTSQMCEPNKIQEILMVKNVKPLGNDSWLVDIGKVITGWFEIELPQLTSGHEVTAMYSDNLTPEGELDIQGESDIYIASGKPGDKFCNKFNHHAFRYIQLNNLPKEPTAAQIKAYLVHGDYRPAATFSCSDNDLNAIHDMIFYTMKCLTFSGYMVDCPHIERAGYGGDGNSSTNSLQTMYNVAPTFMNWIQTWHDVMREGGSLPHVAPNPGAGGGGPYWCGFIIQAPWRTYVNYNDRRMIERFYDTMIEWMKYVDKYTVNGLLQRWPDLSYRDWYLGDWLAPHGVDTGNEASINLVNNCFISECLGTLQKIAEELGKPEDAKRFAARKTALNQLLHQTFFNPETNTYATGSQLDMSYPVLVGVVPKELKDKVNKQLIAETIEKYNNHIAVGLVGVPVLTDWALQNKQVDFMYSLLKQPDYPGYLHMLSNGATTTWEYWSGERSRVHNCYNGIGTWFYQAVGGILVDEKNPGYRHIFIEPQIPQGVTWAKTTKESPYGTITINWEINAKHQVMYISLPIGVEASVAIPCNSVKGSVNRKEVNTDQPYLSLTTGVYEIDFELQ